MYRFAPLAVVYEIQQSIDDESEWQTTDRVRSRDDGQSDPFGYLHRPQRTRPLLVTTYPCCAQRFRL